MYFSIVCINMCQKKDFRLPVKTENYSEKGVAENILRAGSSLFQKYGNINSRLKSLCSNKFRDLCFHVFGISQITIQKLITCIYSCSKIYYIYKHNIKECSL